MKNKINISRAYFLPLVFIVVFLLGFFVFFERAKAQTTLPEYKTCFGVGVSKGIEILDPPESDCKKEVYECGNVRNCYCGDESSPHLCCITSNMTEYICIDKKTGEKVATATSGEPADITYVSPDAPRVKSPEKRVVKFKPNITIPGSKFITGREVPVNGETLGEWISAFYIFFCGVVGILAAVNIIFGGFKYLTSFGNASRMSAAKERITSAIIGLFLTLGAYVILVTISPQLVKFKSLSIEQIEPIQSIEAAESSLKGAPAVSWDGGNVDKYDTQLLKAATTYQIDRNWLKALMLIESGGDPKAESKDKDGNPLACGLIQLLPSTAGMTCEELKNPDVNTMAAAKYYASLMKDTCPATATTRTGKTIVCDLPTNCKDGTTIYANAAYNGGPGANCSSHDEACANQTWWECENLDGFAQTRAYVQKVQQAYDKIIENGW